MKSPLKINTVMIKHCICLIFSASLLCCTAGCGGPEQVQYNPAWVLDEHGNPDFKPEDFHQAIDKLRTDFPLISQAPAARRPDLIQMYQQVIRWLPEFAADSEIRRNQWDTLQNKASQLLKESAGSSFFDQSGYQSLLAKLNDLATMVPVDKKPVRAQNNPSAKTL
ncbi:MAG: hypothetical protein ACKO5E_22710 [bacterium]